jgi:hypothetical protein
MTDRRYTIDEDIMRVALKWRNRDLEPDEQFLPEHFRVDALHEWPVSDFETIARLEVSDGPAAPSWVLLAAHDPSEYELRWLVSIFEDRLTVILDEQTDLTGENRARPADDAPRYTGVEWDRESNTQP